MVSITDYSTSISSTETDLFSIIVKDGTYGCRIYLDNMVTGDVVVFRMYVRNASGSIVRKGKPVTRMGKCNPDDQYVYFAPEFAHGYKITAQVIAGTATPTFNLEQAQYL